jgi:putative Ca2+/H+ antiporter (TMEM165/GDT1 family)
VEPVAATALAFGAVFVAEFGDKSQLLILAFATRHPWQPVVVGLIVAAATIQGLSVALGATFGAALPPTAVAVVSGFAFLAVAAWTLRGEDDDDPGAPDAARGRRLAGIGLILAVAGTFILSELGDKTMLATFALAATQGPLPTWIGSTAGEVAANLVAVTVGRGFGHRLSPRSVRVGSAALFALAGLFMLAGALVGQG